MPVVLTLWERDLIHDKTFCDPDFAKCAAVDGTGVRVELSLDEIEEIQGYVAAVANHTNDPNYERNLIDCLPNSRCVWVPIDDESE